MTSAAAAAEDGFSDNDPYLAPPLSTLHPTDICHERLRPLLYKLWIAADALQLGPESTYHALVFLHRYYSNDDDADGTDDDQVVVDGVNWKWIAAACIVLGTKMAEEPRRLRDVINMAHMLDFGPPSASSSLSVSLIDDDCSNIITLSKHPPELNQDYWKAKDLIVTAEQILLRVLKFDVVVGQPHRLIVLLVQDFNLDPTIVVKEAYQNLSNALLSYPAALKHSSLALACAAIELVQPGTIISESSPPPSPVVDIQAALSDLTRSKEITMNLGNRNE